MCRPHHARPHYIPFYFLSLWLRIIAFFFFLLFLFVFFFNYFYFLWYLVAPYSCLEWLYGFIFYIFLPSLLFIVGVSSYYELLVIFFYLSFVIGCILSVARLAVSLIAILFLPLSFSLSELSNFLFSPLYHEFPSFLLFFSALRVIYYIILSQITLS